MDLYPSLADRFKSEGVCPICLLEIGTVARYMCENGHTMCQRCKPYYYDCPSCFATLHPQHPDGTDSYHGLTEHHAPSAPSSDDIDFLQHERQAYDGAYSYDRDLLACRYSSHGCWVKTPRHLLATHESRCQFRPNLEEERLSTDLRHNDSDLTSCPYESVGCKVRMPVWRRDIHRQRCNYKDAYEEEHGIIDDMSSLNIVDGNSEARFSDELTECRFKVYGCKVRMPGWRKSIHESKCNYKDHEGSLSEESEEELDPEEQVECRWNVYGCRVMPKRHRKETHEMKCNHRPYDECDN